LYRELLATRYELDHEAKRKNEYEKELETVRETQATWAKFWKEVSDIGNRWQQEVPWYGWPILCGLLPRSAIELYYKD